MWLLNAETIRLEHFMDDRTMYGKYAILSHTWEEEEVSFDMIHLDAAKTMKGYHKIAATCRQALTDGLSYAWIDTCCIDKRSSAELSEAINSMYRWYYNAAVCYAYLSDFGVLDQPWARSDLGKCRWFTRGWTLQELIAPRDVVVYDLSWKMFARRSQNTQVLADVTHIDSEVLRDREQLWKTSVATRMSWASIRETTREEDVAYSLLGIFNINMPLLYGEGTNAFQRLQEEIIRTWHRVDHSILAWDGTSVGLLADSPAQFPVYFPPLMSITPQGSFGPHSKRNIISWSTLHNETFELSNRGLRVTLFARAVKDHGDQQFEKMHAPNTMGKLDLGAISSERLLVALNCTSANARDSVFGLYLRRRPWVTSNAHVPTHADRHDYAMYDFERRYTKIPIRELSQLELVTVTIARNRIEWSSDPEVELKWNSTMFSLRRPGMTGTACEQSTIGPIKIMHARAASTSLRICRRRKVGLVMHIERWEQFQLPALRISVTREDSRGSSEFQAITHGTACIFLLHGRLSGLKVSADFCIVAGRMTWTLSIDDALSSGTVPFSEASECKEK